MKNNDGYSLVESIRNLASLCKVFLSSAIALSSLTGYIIYAGVFPGRLWFVVSGVFFLSCAASSLNQYQERKADALMSRTSGRPLPSEQITPSQALRITAILSLAGSILLFYVHPLCLMLGLFNMIWYNGIYTKLKYKSSFAVMAGAISGAVPPLIGYVAAGGGISDPSILFVCLFMYLWQIPHFWLLLNRYEEDYQKAGIILVTKKIPDRNFKRILFIWITATSISSLFFPYFGIVTKTSSVIALMIFNTGIILLFSRLLFFNSGKSGFKMAYIVLNTFMIFVLLVLLLK